MKLILVVLFSVPLFVKAQNNSILVEGESPNLFVTHKVAAKENYYSIGRIYNVSPKEVAPFNNLVLENGLSLGQTLKIPLIASNFLQTGNAASDEVLVPVYHIVEGKEGLYRISVRHNKLPVETIRQWNKIKGDAVGNGTKLIVGYLKVKKELSSLAILAKEKAIEQIPAQQAAAPIKPIVAAKEPVLPAQPFQQAASGNKTVAVSLPVVEKVSGEPVAEKQVKQALTEVELSMNATERKSSKGGWFKSDFDQQIRNGASTSETGEAGLFKSTSGWEDGKYYCLHNSSTPGTIVKITNASSGKTVYAKVLDQIPDIKQNAGLLVRISNAAAEELGAGEAKFDCTLTYSK